MNFLGCQISCMITIGMCGNFWTWIDVWDVSFSPHKLTCSDWAQRIQCLIFSCRNELWQAVNSWPRCSTRIPRLQTALFTFETGIRVTQGTIPRMRQSFNTAAKVSGLSRLHARLHRVLYRLHQLLLSRC